MNVLDPLSGRCAGPARGPVPLVLLLVLAAGACMATGGGHASEYAERPVTVSVENQNWHTVHVYVLAGGQSQSLGQVSSQSTGEFQVPATIMGSRQEIRLVADPVGTTRGFISDRILVRPGNLVEWTVTQPLAHSRVMVR